MGPPPKPKKPAKASDAVLGNPRAAFAAVEAPFSGLAGRRGLVSATTVGSVLGFRQRSFLEKCTGIGQRFGQGIAVRLSCCVSQSCGGASLISWIDEGVGACNDRLCRVRLQADVSFLCHRASFCLLCRVWPRGTDQLCRGFGPGGAGEPAYITGDIR